MVSQSTSSSSRIGFGGLLTISFVVLNWSWWWVLSPIWIAMGIVVIVFGVVLNA